MKIVKGIKNLKEPTKGSVVTIGMFDGMHIGHRKVIGMAVSRAEKLGLKSVVVTFDPNPAKILGPKDARPTLISLDHRIRLVKDMGADIVIVLKFTREFSKLSPESFVKNILAKKLKPKEIYVGENFYFGKGAAGGSAALQRLSRSYGFLVKTIKPVRIGKDIVSSSLVRRFIALGELRRAARFLGRDVSVLGTVKRGARIASVLGYPTANINPHHETIPPAGVYAVRVRFGKRSFKGVLNIGVRPTFYGPRDREPAIEVHIFNFRQDIYDKDIEVLFVKKMRDESIFESRDDLVRQIRLDAAKASSILR